MPVPFASLLGSALSFIARNGQPAHQAGFPTLVHLTLVTLQVAGIGIGVSIVLAMPIGIWLGHIHRGSFVAISLGNVWRSLPSLAILAIGIAFLGPGLSNVELALIILAVPPMMTNAYVAVDGVDSELVDAARGMGLTGWQTLYKVELPLAIPLIFAGIRTSALFVVASTTLAALAGFSGTLGDVVFNEPSYGLSGVFGGAIVIAGMALLIEGILVLVQRGLTPRGLKLAHAERSALEPAPAVA